MIKRTRSIDPGSLMSSGLVLVLAAGLLSGCVHEVPLVSNETRIRMSVDTLEEQRAWVEEQADIVIKASGVAEGWHQRRSTREDFAWIGPSEERSAYLTGLLPQFCGGTRAGRLDLGLNNDVVLENPLAVADRVRAFWEAEGWVVSEVLPVLEGERDLRADREDGALLGFTATPDGLLIEIYTSCSADASVTDWMHQSGRDSEFQDELDAREE